MDALLALIRAGDSRWLTVPRFAFATWAGVLVVVLAPIGHPIVATAVLVLCLISITRLLWLRLLPHEAARLESARLALAAARPDEAIRRLRQPLSVTGMHYNLQRAMLLATAYSRKGKFREAHGALSEIDERRLLPDEDRTLRCAWARLLLEAGNLREAAQQLDGLEERQLTQDTGCLLVKSWIALETGEHATARALLERALDRNPHAGHPPAVQRMLLLNNLATIEGAQGRPAMQLERLQAARAAFQQAPRADLSAILHHNLAIALVRAGQTDAAREVLREAWAAGDATNLRHVLEVLNNNLLAAREAGDASWTGAVHEEFDRQLTRLGPVSPREQFTLNVSQLRMRRNDGIPSGSEPYEALIEGLLRDLDHLPMGTPIGERIAALREIRHDLKRAIETTPATADVSRLVALGHRVTGRLLENREAVDAYLQTLPPTLIGPIMAWRGHQTEMDKASIQLADSQEARLTALDRLFAHLREKAEWLTEQGTAHDAIEAWIILCDEHVAFHDQLPEHERAAYQRAHRHLAEQALDQAAGLLEQQSRLRDHADHMIGVAYFSLLLRDDRAAAAKWADKLAQQKPALDQYASWLREQYAWVNKQLFLSGFK